MDGDRSSKKLRKPYTITKSRDRWSDEEHERFLDGLLLFGREWKKIEDFVGTKTVIQIRSHAQKYFLKVQKNGLMAHVPPPRPKRNCAYPYLQKDSEDGMVPTQSSMVFPFVSSCFVPSCTLWDDKSMLVDYTFSESMSSSNYHALLAAVEGESGSSEIAGIYNQNFCRTDSSGSSWLTYDVPEQGSQQSLHPVNLMGNSKNIALKSDEYCSDITFSLGVYLQKLKEMDPITAKTVLVLVKNLTVNLSSSDVEPLRWWLLTYESNTKTTGENSMAAAMQSR